MKVKDLIERLQTFDADAEVIMSRDGEGNGYSPLSSLEACVYEAESTWGGDITDEESFIEDLWHENVVDIDFEFETEEQLLSMLLEHRSYDYSNKPVLAVVLWPTN